MSARKLSFVVCGMSMIVAACQAQVPDLLNALDAGGRAMGAGGSFYSTGADTLSSYYNPAGLGYLQVGQFGVAYRNLPKSRSQASDEFGNLDFDSAGKRGNSAISHLGLAFPMNEGKRGTLSVSYTIGGFIDDERVNAGVLVGGNPVNVYTERVEAKSEYFTLAYGIANAAQSFSWGVGLQFVRQRVANDILLVDSSNTVLLDSDVDETGSGIGGIVGIQYIPRNNPNMSLGLSFRTPINLSGNEDTSALYDEIPARLMAGLAYRQDGLRGNRDFIVYGLQAQHFFAGKDSQVFDRSAQTTIGFGLEYSYQTQAFRIPIRLGYNVIPSGGEDFGHRNGFTFGFGYRPNNNRYGVDFNFVSPEKGGYDIGISLNYRFGK